MAVPGAPQQPNAYQPDENIKKMRDQFFKSKREEAVGGANAQAQEGSDAIQRRFASMGASGSGAQIAAMQKNREAGMDATRKAQADVGAMELQAGEQDAGRSFQMNEANTARQFQSGMADKDMAFKQRLADTDQSNKLVELDLAKQQFALDKDTTAFNQRMAEIEAGREPSKGMFDKIGDNIESVGKTAGTVGIRGTAALMTGGLSEAIPDVSSYSCWVFSRMTKEGLKLPKDMKKLMTKFKNNWVFDSPDFTRFYIRKCKTLIEKMDEQKFDWKTLFWFSDALYAMFKNGQQIAAQDLFQSTIADLVEKYWDECPHKYAHKIIEELAHDKELFEACPLPEADKKDEWMLQVCFQDLSSEVFKDEEA